MTKAHSQTNRVSLWKLFPPWFIPISGGRVVQVATVECACKRSMVCCTLRHYWTVCGNQPTTCHDFSGCSPYLWHTGCKRVTDIETRRGPQPFLREISCSHPLYSFCERIVESVILFILFFMENGLTRYEIWVSERAFRLIFRRENFICMFSLFDFNKKSTIYDLVAFDLYPPWYSEKCVAIEIFNSIRIYVAIFRINIKNLAPDSRRRSWWIKNDACVESSWNMKLWRE